MRVHVPEVDREPRVSAGGGGGRRGQAQAQGDQYYTISTISIYTYIFNSLLYQVVKLPDPTIFTITSPSQETSYFYKLKNLFAINSKIP